MTKHTIVGSKSVRIGQDTREYAFLVDTNLGRSSQVRRALHVPRAIERVTGDARTQDLAEIC